MMNEIGLHVSSRLLAAGVCPAAPPGTQQWFDQMTGWAKAIVLAVMGISSVASIGMLVWGKAWHHPKGARLGFDGLMICIVAAILYTVGPQIITSITGKGC